MQSILTAVHLRRGPVVSARPMLRARPRSLLARTLPGGGSARPSLPAHRALVEDGQRAGLLELALAAPACSRGRSPPRPGRALLRGSREPAVVARIAAPARAQLLVGELEAPELALLLDAHRVDIETRRGTGRRAGRGLRAAAPKTRSRARPRSRTRSSSACRPALSSQSRDAGLPRRRSRKPR